MAITTASTFYTNSTYTYKLPKYSTTNYTWGTTTGTTVTWNNYYAPTYVDYTYDEISVSYNLEIPALMYDGTDWTVLPKKKVVSKLGVKNRKRIDVGTSTDVAELKARATLRDILTEKEYRRYITNGFVVVKGEFDFHYQIFHRKAGHVVNVYKKNKLAGTLCIQTDQKCPPTDHVMNLMMRVKFDEVSVWEGANYSGFSEVMPLVNKHTGIVAA